MKARFALLGLPALSVAVILAGCGGGGKMSADALAKFVDTKIDTTREMSKVRCTKGVAGWDYVCAYDDTRHPNGRMKMALNVDAKRPTEGSGAVPVGDLLPPAPFREPMGREEFVAKANALCAGRSELIRAVPKARDRATLLVRAELLTRIQRSYVRDLSELRPPRDRQQAYDRLWDGAAVILRGMQGFRGAVAERHQAEAVRTAAIAQQGGREYDAAAAELGLACRAVR